MREVWFNDADTGTSDKFCPRREGIYKSEVAEDREETRELFDIERSLVVDDEMGSALRPGAYGSYGG